MMNNTTVSVILKPLMVTAVALLMLGGCRAPATEDGENINSKTLPAGSDVDLYCEDVGIHPEDCVLDDPNNPYANVSINEPLDLDCEGDDKENKHCIDPVTYPLPITKWDLADDVELFPKAKFYLWATALARSPTGEHQYHTARALHELFTDSSDEAVQKQTVRALCSALDNFFGSVTRWEFNFLADSHPDRKRTHAQSVADLVGEHLTGVTRAGGPLFIDPMTRKEFKRLFVDDPISLNRGFATISQWGYRYVESSRTISLNEEEKQNCEIPKGIFEEL